jgi:hypothetical protein
MIGEEELAEHNKINFFVRINRINTQLQLAKSSKFQSLLSGSDHWVKFQKIRIYVLLKIKICRRLKFPFYR